MKILDLLDRDDTIGFSQSPIRAYEFHATLDQIDQLWLDGELNEDEAELLSYVSYRLRHSPSYRMSDSIVAAIDLMRTRVFSAT